MNRGSGSLPPGDPARGPFPVGCVRRLQRSTGLVGSARADRYPKADDFVSWRLRLVRSMAPHC